MFIPKKVLKFWLILFIPLFIALGYGTYRHQQKNTTPTSVEQRASLIKHIGSKLPLLPLKNTSYKFVSLNHSFQRPVILDFWFEGCSPCIAEMKQFSKLLKEYPGKFEIISISIDPLSEWKNVLNGKSSENLSFLFNDKDTLWTHLNLDTANPSSFLVSSLNLSQYPSYFVLDSNGTIIETPQSAVKYIEKVIGKKMNFTHFLWKSFTSEEGWINLLFSFLYYSGLFWSLVILILWIRILLKTRNSH